MCCDNKCLFFIKARTGSLIYGYIAAITSGIVVLIGVGLTLYFATSMIFSFGSSYPIAMIEVVYLSQLFIIENTASFTFSVLLLCGLTKNKPVLVKTYIIYGMIHLVLLLIVMIILFCLAPLLGVLGLIFNGIYTLFIHMVYLTYKIMITESERASFTNPPNLLLS